MRSVPLTRLLTALCACLLLVLPACKPKSGKDHYALAKQLEQEMGLTGDYTRAEYEKVSQELMLAQEGDDTYEQAQAWLKEIRKAQSTALWGTDRAPEVEEGGFHPSVPSQAELAAAERPAGSMTAAGWMPYTDAAPAGGGGGSGGSAARAGTTTKRAKGPVVLYGTSWCGVCAQARSYFRSKGVSFVDKDVEKDASAMREMKLKAPQATGYPVIDIGGEIMPGFSASALDAKLGL